METKTQNHSELSNEEYFKAVIDLQPEVIATVNKKLSKEARKLAEADYEKWVRQCREHRMRACWDSTCPGELEFVLEYTPAQERGASIVTARCSTCGKEYRLQDYEENVIGMKGRAYSNISRAEQNIEYKEAEIEKLKEKLAEAKAELKTLKAKSRDARKFAKTVRAN